MAVTRREVVHSALIAALAVAIPRTVFALQLTAKQRFLIVALKNGKHMAIDHVDGKKAYLLSRSPADGKYALAKQGALVADHGIVRKLETPAETNHYKLSQKAGVLVVHNEDGEHVLDVAMKGG